MEKPNHPDSSGNQASADERAAAAEHDRDAAIRELETIQSMRIVRLGLALSETVSSRDVRGLPRRVSGALRRSDAPGRSTSPAEPVGTVAASAPQQSGLPLPVATGGACPAAVPWEPSAPLPASPAAGPPRATRWMAS